MPSSKSTLCSGDAKAFIRDYMKSQYRPYSTSDIQSNLHNQVTRSKLGPILDDLVAEKELIVKTIGKTNYYCFKELHIEENVGIDAGGEEEAFKEQLKVLEARIEILLTDIAKVSKLPSNEKLVASIASIESEINKLQQKFESIAEQSSNLELKEIQKYSNNLVAVHKSRKQLFKDLYGKLTEVIDGKEILEACDICPQELQSNLCL
ncbi:hypothetical protein PVL30_004307 [Lodderomyces elongisporus]|uniref:uncharacterized protein n=1 Tax=Lodderomyces elongisporus TaxID=36914 RepID=UPI00291EABBF|nr:uncharacterized protein PVL30_004307 [Lodderomyces elongisporus]WLF80524.1 hypothetical protein PVL30_004307 [Lodderomyces elongisporus]